MAIVNSRPIQASPALKDMRLPKGGQPGDVDLRPMVQKIVTRWYVLLASALAFFLVAYIYVKTSPNIFEVRTTLVLEDQSSGSKRAEELLEMLEVKTKGIKVEDEIGLIKSYNIIQKTMERLDFTVTYFEVERNIFNQWGKELQVTEKYKDFPFRIVLNPAANQMTGTKIYVRLLSDKSFELSVRGEDVQVHNLQTRELTVRLPTLNYIKVLPVGVPYQDPYLNFKLVLNAGQKARSDSRYYFIINDLGALTGQYLGKVTAKPIQRESRILEISSEGPIIEKEVKFLNTLVDVLIETDLEQKNKTGQKTLNFLDKQLSKISDSLRRSESALSVFRSSNKVSAGGGGAQTVYQKLDNLETEKARIDVQMKYYQSVLRQLETNSTVTDVVSPSTMGIENSILTTLLLELTSLNRQVAGISVSAKRDAPMVRVLESKIDNAKQAVSENLANNLNAARITLGEVNRRIAEVEGNIYQLPESERRLQDLQGKTDFNAKTYNFMLEKRAEAAVTLAANQPDKRRVDEARVTGGAPISPKSKQIYLVAIIIGLLLPAGLIIVIDRLDNTIRSKEDLEGLTQIPFLGIVTDAGKNRKLPVVDKPLSAISESFRSLRINLQYLAAGMDKKIIGITSSISGEGKTFCSANIAAELALSGKRVILIEADLRRPTLNRYFELDQTRGLSSLLIKSSTLAETIQSTRVEGLDVICSGPIPPNPVELLSLPAMHDLVETLRAKYEYIVFDIPPIGFVSEYYILLQYLDANLFVTRYKYTNRALLADVDQLYREGKVSQIYTVLNGLNYYQKYEYRNTGQKYYRG